MKRFALVACLVAVSMVVVACSGGGAPAGGGTSSGTTSAPSADAGASYTVLPMGANEQAVLAKMPEVVAEYKAGKVKDGKVEGTDWLDVTGITPELVGYSVNAFNKLAGTDDIEIIELDYVNGHITRALSPDSEVEGADVELDTLYYSNGIAGPESPGDGEKAALAAAKAWMADNRPGTSWTWGVKHYLFLYRKGDVGAVLGTTLTGGLDRSGGPVKLAK